MNLFRHLLGAAQFHGSQRLKTERKYRFWWIVTLLLCLWSALSIIMANIWQYLETPSYLVITETAETNIKFPSVIVCPQVNYPQYKIDAFLSGLKYPSGMNESDIKSIIRQLATFYTPDMTYSFDDVLKIEMFLDYNNINVESASQQMTVTCEEAIVRCRYFGEMVNCSRIFVRELTNLGYCCIFNGRSLRREMHKHGIHNVDPPPQLRSDMVGHNSGLMFVVNASQEMNNIDLDYTWMYLARGQQFVEHNANGTPIVPNQEFWVAYDSQRFVLDQDASELSAELRRCRKVSEKLTYFPSYLRSYCLVECEMQRTMEQCHCISITHPKPPQWNYCNARSLLCAKNSAVTSSDTQCNCPPTCDTTQDFIITTNFPLIRGNYIMDPFYDGLDFSKVTIVRGFLLHHDTKVNERRSIYNSIYLFSQIGGTLNVFFGCSILTMAELIQLLWYGGRQYRTVKRLRKQRAKVNQRPAIAKKDDKIKNKVIKKTVKFQK